MEITNQDEKVPNKIKQCEWLWRDKMQLNATAKENVAAR